MLFQTIFALILVLLNGFFVAAEFSIVKVRYSRIQLRAGEGNKFARVAQSIIEHLDTYLSATQLGITLASLGLGWIGEPVAADLIASLLSALNISIDSDRLHSISMPVGFLVITILHIVIGELAPKSIAIRKAETTALVISYPLRLFFLIFKPFIWFMNVLSNGLLSIIGIKPVEGHEIYTDEEFKLLMEQSKNAGALKEEKYDIMKNAFEFTDHVARQIMIPRQRVFSVDIQEPIDNLISIVIENGYSQILVMEGSLDAIRGIIYSKDLFKAHYLEKPFTLQELIHPVYYVIESTVISEILAEFQKRHIHIAVVVDEYGGTEGIITMDDILDELIGEIQEEGDNASCVVRRKNGNTFLVQATSSLEDINERLPTPISVSKDYVTLSGVLIEHLGKFPLVGEEFEYGAYKVKIIKMQDWVIQQVLLESLREPPTLQV